MTNTLVTSFGILVKASWASSYLCH